MQRWEYKKMVNPNTDDINNLGEDGWEMCGAYGISDQIYQTQPPITMVVLYFKKPKNREKRTATLNIGPSHTEMITDPKKEKEAKELIKKLKRID